MSNITWKERFLGKAALKEAEKNILTMLIKQKDIIRHDYLFSLLSSDYSKQRLI